MHISRYAICKTRGEKFDASQAERLEFYEKQLIDMKIRLDALEIQGIEQKVDDDPNLELKKFLEKLAKNDVKERPTEVVSKSEIIPEKVTSMLVFQMSYMQIQLIMCYI